MSDPPSLAELVLGYMPARIIHVSARLGLADLLADGPRGSADLAAATRTDPPSLHRLLRALAALDVVAEVEPGRFVLTPAGHQLRSAAPDSIRGLAMLCATDQVWLSWGNLLHSVRTGGSAWELVSGMKPFDWMRTHPEDAEVFNAAMADQTRRIVPGLVRGFDYSRFRTIVDVGGGDGTVLAAILTAHPSPEGILYDLPSGAESAPGTLATAGVADRCRIVHGDFFEAVPPGADAYLLKSVIHDWPDDRAEAILRSCHRAMGDEATLLLVELLLPTRATPDARAVLMSDISMLVNPGGRERTEDEFRALLKSSGFDIHAVVTGLGCGYCLIEARPS